MANFILLNAYLNYILISLIFIIYALIIANDYKCSLWQLCSKFNNFNRMLNCMNKPNNGEIQVQSIL